MDYATFHQHLSLHHADTRRLERETELLRRIAERRRDASGAQPVTCEEPGDGIRRGWRLVLRWV